ncbi:MAG: class I SAM-dependent methyltransferase [Anaerolineae bacterium]|nr:class I SAM-dependent methyltransferase [Anaerolineae bacterium]
MHVSCPYCNAQADFLLYAQDENRHSTSETFTYYRCPSCGLIFLYPLPADLSKYYVGDYHAQPATHSERALHERLEAIKLAYVQRYARGNSLLEIGPSYGAFLRLAVQAGFKATAIELDADCVAALNAAGIPAIQSAEPAQALKALGQYDVIGMWHVIEHLPAAWDVLSEAAQHLAPNGVLIVAAPNPQALTFQLFKARWSYLDAPRHVYLLPMRLVERVARQSGLVPIARSANNAEARWHNFAAWRSSLINLIGKKRVQAALSLPQRADQARSRSSRLRARVFRLGLRALTLAAAPLELTGARGSAYTLIFRKPA